MTLRIFFTLCILTYLGTQTLLAETFTLNTEDYPPYNMISGANHDKAHTDDINGISTEIVRSLFTRAKIDYTIQLLPWKRAIAYAEKFPYQGVYSTSRTPQREDRFKWVGPLVENNWCLFAKTDSPIQIDSLEEARKYAIGGYSGDALTQYLETKGIVVDQVPLDDINIKKLKLGRIDLWAAGNLLGKYRAQKQNIKIKNVFTFFKGYMWIALNKETPETLINKLNHMLKDLKKEGKIKQIQEQYGIFK